MIYNIIILLIFEYNKTSHTENFITRSQSATFPSFRITMLNQAVIYNAPELIDTMIAQLE